MEGSKIEIEPGPGRTEKGAAPEGGKDQNVGEYQRAQIKDMGSATAESARGVIHCLTIIGQIEGHQILLRRRKPQNTSMLCRSWRPWRSRRKSRASSFC